MKRARFTEEQITGILREKQAGAKPDGKARISSERPTAKARLSRS